MALAGWDPDNKILITIAAADLEMSLTDFILPLYLSVSSGKSGFDATPVFTALGANSKKIAIEIGNTGNQCYVEIVHWDHVAGEGAIHINAGALVDTTDNTWQLYYDSTQPDNATYITSGAGASAAVYPEAISVKHMAQDPSIGGACILDSVTAAQNGIPAFGLSGSHLIAGDRGYGLSLASGRSVDSPDTGLTPGEYTQIIRVKRDTQAGYGVLYCGFYPYGAMIFVYETGVVAVGDAGGAYATFNAGFTDKTSYHTVIAVNPAVGLPELYLDGVAAGTASRDIPKNVPFDSPTIGRTANPNYGYLSATISEVMIFGVRKSAAWISAISSAFEDQLVTLTANGGPIPTVVLRSMLDQDYGLLANFLRSVIVQPYHLTERYVNGLVQLYGSRMLASLIQYYGNMPQYRARIEQRYGDCFFLRRLLTQEYGNAARYSQILDQEWDSFTGLRNILSQRYSIAEKDIRAMVDEIYDLSERDRLRQVVEQIYVLAAGDALVQRIDMSILAINDGEVQDITSFYNINIEQDEGLFYMSGEIQLCWQGDYLQFIHLNTDVEITIDSITYHLIPETPRRLRSGVGVVDYVVPLVSKTMLLDHAESELSIVGDNADISGMSKTLVEGLAAPVALVDWRLPNWFIPSQKLYVNGESRMAVIKRIVHATGGVVQTLPDGTLVCRPEYPVSVNQWSATPPDFELTDQDDFFQIMPVDSPRNGYNRFFLTDEQLGSDDLRIEDIQISDRIKEVRVFMVPWDNAVRINLHHSGGLWVQIIADGVKTISVSEQVEFQIGTGRVSKPVYSGVEVDYSERDLGGVTASEEGNLVADIAKNSLAQVSYVTRYFKFLVIDNKVEDVQVYPEVISG